MDIPVKFYTTARELFGKKHDIIILEQGGSVEDLLGLLLETRLPGGGTAHSGGGANGRSREELVNRLVVFVNEVRAVDMRDILKEGDRVSLFGTIS